MYFAQCDDNIIDLFQQFFIDGVFKFCDKNSDGWVDIDEYTEILRWFREKGSDIDAAINFLFAVYDVNGKLQLRKLFSVGNNMENN